jgi:hypothetical protein
MGASTRIFNLWIIKDLTLTPTEFFNNFSLVSNMDWVYTLRLVFEKQTMYKFISITNRKYTWDVCGACTLFRPVSACGMVND